MTADSEPEPVAPMSNNWREKTDDELAQDAYRGDTSQGAVVEMMRRLKDALEEQQKAAEKITKLTKVLVWFTAALILLALVQIWPLLTSGQ